MKNSRTTSLSYLSVSAVLASLSTLVAQGEVAAPKTVACYTCKSRGAMPCKAHKKDLVLEKDVLFCSVASACPKCAGTYQTDCKICRNEAVESAAVTRREQVQAWFADRRANVEKFTKSKGILHGKTKHVDLTFSLAPMRIGDSRRKSSQHEMLHIWLDRFEAQYAAFCAMFELTEADFAVPLELYMFEKQVDHQEIAPRKVGASAGRASGKKYMGDKMIFSMWRLPREFKNDADLQRYMAHHVTHLLVNHMAPHTWIFNKHHGWIDAGLAHLFEYTTTELCTNVCYEEIGLDPGTTWKGGKWKSAVRILFEEGKPPPFSEFYSLNTDQLSLTAHALSFAYVDYLVSAHGGAKMRDLIRAVKNKTPTRDAMRKIYGLSPLTIDAKVKDWVKKNYPRRERRRR